ncbi:MAG: Do family serine endopeptidase [bacterium]|nr:Do family serine endopeptidase [bacterium]
MEHNSNYPSKSKRWIAMFSIAMTLGFIIGILFTAGKGWNTSASASIPSYASNNYESPFVAIAERLKPSVVNIQVEKKGVTDDVMRFHQFRDFFPFFDDEIFPETPRRRTPRQVSSGSGFIVGKNGLILTNNHVVEGSDKIKVKFAEGKEKTAEIIGTDPDTDIALIKVNETFSDELVVKWSDSDKLRVGEWAIAIGNPFGLDWTVTVGVISALGRSNLPIAGGGPTFQDFIQTDASINFGNSGGPLLNIRGEVIGINSAVNTQGQGIGFAIPSNMAQKVIAQLQTKGKVQRGYMGLVPAQLDDAKRAALSAPSDLKGIFVDNVQENTPADKAGLRAGDIIMSVNGKTFTDPTQFRLWIADHSPGETLEVKVWRDGKVREYEITLGDRSTYLAESRGAIRSKSIEKNWLGIEVASLESNRARRFQIDADYGVVVVNIEEDSPADNVLNIGDVILEVNKRRIETIDDWNEVRQEFADRADPILFRIQRGSQKTFVTVTPK